MLPLQAIQPRPLAGPGQGRLRLFRQLGVEAGVAAPRGPGRGPRGRSAVQALAGVLPQRLREPEAHPGVLLFAGVDQRLLHQEREQGQDVRLVEALPGAHRFRRLEGEAPGEDGQAVEEGALLRGQQAVAPVHQGAQGLVTGRGGAVPSGQEAETVVQALGQLAWTEHRHAGRRQLDGQGDAVQPAADREHVPGVLGAERESGLPEAGPLDEQAHGPVALHRFQGRHHLRALAGPAQDVILRRGQGRDAVGHLTGHPQGLLAGGQELQSGAGPQERIGQAGAGVQDVLAVVQHQQQAALRQGARQGLRHGLSGHLAHVQGGGHRLPYQGRIGHRAQLHQPHPVRIQRTVRPAADVLPHQAPCHLEGQARLAAAPGAGQRHQARAPLGGLPLGGSRGAQQQAPHLRDLGLASDEAGHRGREVVPAARDRSRCLGAGPPAGPPLSPLTACRECPPRGRPCRGLRVRAVRTWGVRDRAVRAGEGAGQDVLVEALTGRVRLRVQLPAQGLAQVLELAQRQVPLPAAGVQAHQPLVGRLVGGIGGDGPGQRRALPLAVARLLGHLSLLQQQGQVEAAQLLPSPGRPVLVGVLGEELAGVQSHRPGVRLTLPLAPGRRRRRFEGADVRPDLAARIEVHLVAVCAQEGQGRPRRPPARARRATCRV